MLNQRAVEFAVRAGIALGCTINPTSIFARKNYFYPDLPKGYQISQFDRPLCEHGALEFVIDGGTKKASITRIHMEEDAGKSLHDAHEKNSHVDLNRSSMPLIEIVSGPDLHTPQEAGAYLKTLRTILMYLGVCDGNMQEGSLRCDANVSVRPAGSTTLGTRAELKNVNSFRYVERAIAFEIERQVALVQRGEKVVQETRLWDETRNVTESMRSKEEAHDYRYFPEPDLLPLALQSAWIEEIRSTLPELPAQKKSRFIAEYGLSEYDARVLTSDYDTTHFYESALKVHAKNPKGICNWITTEMFGRLNAENIGITEGKITPHALATLVARIDDGTITGKIAKTLFEDMYANGADPEALIASKGLKAITDVSAIEPIVDQILAANEKNVAAYRAGKTGLIGFFVGQVMKATQGQATPQIVQEILQKKLG